MSSLNRVLLIGRVGKDPEVRSLTSGDRVANFSLATSETWKKDGERKEKTTWHNVVVFNDHVVKTVENYVRKGSQIYIEGSLQQRKYEQNGVEKVATEVVLQKFRGELVLLGGKPEGGGGGDDYGAGFSAGPAAKPSQDYHDDDIPFATPFSLF
jgi:single-strand DNA-binding protein